MMSHSSYLQALSQRSNSCLRGCQSLRLQVPRVSASRQPPGSTHSNRAGRLLTWRPSPAPCKAQSRGNAPSTEQASQKLQQPRQSATAALHAGSGSASRQPASGADLWSAAWQTDLTGDEIDMRDLGDWDQLQEAVQQLPGRYKQFMQLYDRGHSFDATEQREGCWLEVVEGQLPQGLCGTWFRNGPGRFGRGPSRYGHPYDGDGLVASAAFTGGRQPRVWYRAAAVDTPELAAERAAGRVLFRGSFGTQRAGGPLANALDVYIKNVSNTKVMEWGGRLISMFEAAPAYSLDPHTLVTRGMETLGGALGPGLPLEFGNERANTRFGTLQRLVGHNRLLPRELTSAGGDACCAHPRVDPRTNRLCLFTYKISPQAGNPLAQDTAFRFWELDTDWNIAAQRLYLMPGYGFVHDFVVTENYYVLFQSPVATDQLPYLMGQVCAASSIRWRPNAPTMVHVVPRPGSTAASRGEPPRTAPLFPPLFVFHHANAYEEAVATTAVHGGADGSGTGASTAGSTGSATAGSTYGGTGSSMDVCTRIIVDSVAYDSLPAVGREALDEQCVDPEASFKARLVRTAIDLTGPSSTSTATAATTAATASTAHATAAATAVAAHPPAAASATASVLAPEPCTQLPPAPTSDESQTPALLPSLMFVTSALVPDPVTAIEPVTASLTHSGATASTFPVTAATTAAGAPAVLAAAAVTETAALLHADGVIGSDRLTAAGTGDVDKQLKEGEDEEEEDDEWAWGKPAPGFDWGDDWGEGGNEAADEKSVTGDKGGVKEAGRQQEGGGEREDGSAAWRAYASVGPLWDQASYIEMVSVAPAVSGARHRYIWGYSSNYDGQCIGLVKVDVAHQGLSQRYDPPPGTFLNEPIFVPRSNSSTASDSAGSTTSDSSTDGSVTSGSTASSTNKADGAADVSPGAVAENNMGCGGDDKMCPADWGVEGDGVDGQGAEAGPTPNNNPSAGEEGTAATDSQGGGEDDGWVLMQAFDAHNMHSELWVFDARTITSGPVARLRLPHPLPHGLHGCWSDTVYGAPA